MMKKLLAIILSMICIPMVYGYTLLSNVTMTNATVRSGNAYNVYGILFAADGSRLGGKTVSLSINAGTTVGVDYFSVDSSADGSFGFSVLPTAGQKVLTFVEGEMEKSTTITVSSGSPIANLDLTVGQITLMSHNASVITHAVLSSAKPAGKADILYSVSASNLTATQSMTVFPEVTYSPEGTVTAATLTIPAFAIVKPTVATTFTTPIVLNGKFDLNGKNTTIDGLSGYGVITSTSVTSRTLTVGGTANTTFNGVILNGTGGTTAITKVGSGVLTLTGSNLNTGATTINGGTLRMGKTNAMASTAVTLANTAGVVLDLNGYSLTVTSIATGGASGGDIYLGAGNATLTIGNASTSYAGIISGTGNVSKTSGGTTTLTGAHTFTGYLSCIGGTVALNGSAVNAVVRQAGGTLSSSSTATVAGYIYNSGSLNSTITIASGGYIGGTGTISSTTMGRLTRSIFSVRPGDPLGTVAGTLSVNAPLTMSASGTYYAQINNTSSDRVTMVSSNALTIDGTLDVSFVVQPTVAQAYTILSGSNRTGTFSSVVLPTPPAGMAWHDYGGGVYVDYTSGQIQLDAV